MLSFGILHRHINSRYMLTTFDALAAQLNALRNGLREALVTTKPVVFRLYIVLLFIVTRLYRVCYQFWIQRAVWHVLQGVTKHSVPFE
jgi:hypothetical protein